MDARIEFAAQVFVGLQKNLEEAREVFFGEKRGGTFERGTLIGRRGDQIGICAADAGDEQVAEMANRFAAEVLEVAAFLLKAVNEGESAVGRAGSDCVDEFFERVFRD